MKLKYINKQLQQLKDWIENWKEQEKKACILTGKPGIGKSSSVYFTAEKLGYEVIEFNSSDDRGQEFMAELYKNVRNDTFTPVLYLLDEFDGMDNYGEFTKILAITKHPIIMTCNMLYKIPQNVIDTSFVIGYYLKSGQVLQIAKQNGLIDNFENLSTDARQSHLVKLGSEGYKKTKTQNERIEDYLKTGESQELTNTDLIVLLDNAQKMFYGFKMYQFIRSIELADKCRNNIPLSNYYSNAKMEPSYFYQKKNQVNQYG